MEQQNRFQIYGRTSYEQPLTFVTEIIAEGEVVNETLAATANEEWIELIAIPNDALLQVIGGDDVTGDEEDE